MKTLLILGTILLSANAFAGNEKGNGGGVHYCAKEQQIELYDIYEAQARFGYEIKDDKSPVQVQINKAVAKITKANSYVGKLVSEQLEYLKKGHTIIRNKTKLTPIGDAKILLTDEGCSYQQLANWDEVSGNLLVKKEYFDLMNNLNQAAFYIHETLYKVARDLNLLEKNSDGSTNSDDVRRMVGEIFSTNESLELMWNVESPQVIAEREKAKEDEENRIYNTYVNNGQEILEVCTTSFQEFQNTKEALPKILTWDIKVNYYSKRREAVDACIKARNELQSMADNPFVPQIHRIHYAHLTLAANDRIADLNQMFLE